MEENQASEIKQPDSGRGMNPMLIIGAVVVLAIVGGGILLLSNKSSSTPQSPEVVLDDSIMMAATPSSSDSAMMEDESMEEDSMMEEGETKSFTLEAGSFYYKPSTIAVKKGDKVKVTINSVDMMHDFVIDEFDAKTEIAKSGTSASVEFVADKTGSFEFYCSVGTHRAQGMVGTLVVQ